MTNEEIRRNAAGALIPDLIRFRKDIDEEGRQPNILIGDGLVLKGCEDLVDTYNNLVKDEGELVTKVMRMTKDYQHEVAELAKLEERLHRISGAVWGVARLKMDQIIKDKEGQESTMEGVLEAPLS